jgi:HD-like signal output (HDOD) protein
VIGLLPLLLIAACGLAACAVWRRLAPFGSARRGGPAETAGENSFDLRDPPEPPLLRADSAQFLDRSEIFHRLRQLELGASGGGQENAAHERVVAAALAAIGDPAAQRQYFPRRPNLLPQLLRAINDSRVSVRQLVAIVARDPALVGSLLQVANSSFYRIAPRPIETIERAIVVLGNDGLRSVMAAALMQPIFQTSGVGAAQRFPELVWEHAARSAHAAIPHAALVERVNPFTAELLCLISGLAEIVLFRVVLEQTVAGSQAAVDPLVIAAILDSQAAAFAWHIGAEWHLSPELLAALREQTTFSEPATALGRSLRFGRCAGALAVLHGNSIIDEPSVRISLPPSGLSPAHLESLLTRLLRPHEDPRTVAKESSANRVASTQSV